MPFYNKKLDGYIADAAQITAKRCDGLVYTCDTATASSVTTGGDSITVNGGWSQYALANIPTSKTLEISFTDAQWNMNMFEFANQGKLTTGEKSIMDHEKFAVTAGPVIAIPFKIDKGFVYIRGLEYDAAGDAASTGKFIVETQGETSNIKFFEGDVAVGDEVIVTFKRVVDQAEIMGVNSNAQSVIAEVTMKFPVYTSGEDCSEKSIKGYFFVYIPKCRCTQPPNVDTSYKTASTYAVSFSAMDPRSATGNVYEYYYVPA